MIHRLLIIQDQQLQTWKELQMLEQRVLLNFLPEEFDQLQNFITTDLYTPIINDEHSVKYQLKYFKVVQESKRIWLDIYLQGYISTIQHYDQSYQQEFIQLSSSTIEANLFQSIEIYLTHRNDQLKEDIHLQMIYFHKKLTRRYRQFQASSLAEQTIGVSPQVIVDVSHHDFNPAELEYLSRGKLDKCSLFHKAYTYIYIYRS